MILTLCFSMWENCLWTKLKTIVRRISVLFLHIRRVQCCFSHHLTKIFFLLSDIFPHFCLLLIVTFLFCFINFLFTFSFCYFYFIEIFILFHPPHTISDDKPKRGRGRPRIKPVRTNLIPPNLNEILSGPQYQLQYVQTKFSSMRAQFKMNQYEFHFNKLGVMYWRCINHTTGCLARILSKSNVVNEITAGHNHPNNSIIDEPDDNVVCKSEITEVAIKKEADVKKPLNLKEQLKMKLAKSFQLN